MSAESPTFSNYGIYDVGDSLDLVFPNATVKIERVGENAFSYLREDTDQNIVEKMIPAKSNHIQVEVAPIRPLNHPARRTNYVFLKFDKEIYLSHNSAASIFIHCPIEIGIFLIHKSDRESLDWITCNPLNSRFGLYGPADTGTLCKYAEVSLATDYQDSIPYVEGVMKIVIENTLTSGQTVSKVIFPITDNSLYYENSKTVIDGIRVTLRKRAVVSIADVKTDPLNTGWTKSPAWEDVPVSTTMEMGLE